MSRREKRGLGQVARAVWARASWMAAGVAMVAALAVALLPALSPAVGGRQPASGGPDAVPPPPALRARSAVLVDMDTGQMLYAHNAFERRPPGSLTKLVTALVVLQSLTEKPEQASATVRVSREAANAPGYGLRLEEGEELPLMDLLAGMLMHPGNDAATALAEHVAGSIQGFAARMNLAAAAQGAGQSSFRNPHGLDEPGHLSTAYDLALVARAVLDTPELARLAGARRAELTWRARRLRNVNSFLWRYPGAAGAVSSYTPASGYSVVAVAARGGARLLAVVLGAPGAAERWMDAASLMDYGFAHRAALSRLPQVPVERYRVEAGDTLSSLARRFDVPISAIRLLNALEDPDRLAVGTELWIPR